MKDLSLLDDNQLITEIKRGNFGAFENLIKRHDKQVFSIAARYVNSAEDAKDIYQEVFCRVHRSINKFKMKSEFSTWLYRITTNVCLTFCKKQQKYYKMAMGLNSLEDTDNRILNTNTHNPALPHQQLSNSEISARVENALNLLSPQQKLVFILRHYEGYKLREISKFLKCTEGTVKKQLFSAIRRLRGDLMDLYLEGASG